MTLKPNAHLTKSECIGQFRLKIIGSLLASPPEKGETVLYALIYLNECLALRS